MQRTTGVFIFMRKNTGFKREATNKTEQTKKKEDEALRHVRVTCLTPRQKLRSEKECSGFLRIASARATKLFSQDKETKNDVEGIRNVLLSMTTTSREESYSRVWSLLFLGVSAQATKIWKVRLFETCLQTRFFHSRSDFKVRRRDISLCVTKGDH